MRLGVITLKVLLSMFTTIVGEWAIGTTIGMEITGVGTIGHGIAGMARDGVGILAGVGTVGTDLIGVGVGTVGMVRDGGGIIGITTIGIMETEEEAPTMPTQWEDILIPEIVITLKEEEAIQSGPEILLLEQLEETHLVLEIQQQDRLVQLAEIVLAQHEIMITAILNQEIITQEQQLLPEIILKLQERIQIQEHDQVLI